MPEGYTPIFKIMKDGTDITENFNDRALSIQVELTGGNNDSDRCLITIDDRDWAVEAVEVGSKIEVYLGYKEVGLAQMGIFEISTVEYGINPRQIKMTGTSVSFMDDLKAPAIVNHDSKTLSEIINGIAATGGVSAYISPELAKIKLPFVNQTTSPLHLLGELERRFGALAKFENGRLIFIDRDEGETASGAEMPVVVFGPAHFSQGYVRHTTRGDYGAVKVGWIDPDTHMKKYHEEKAGDDDGPAFLSNKLARTEEEAKAMARSQMAALRRSTGEAHLTLAKGDPWVRDQQRILVEGMRDRINGSYVIDTVTHTYTKDAGLGTIVFAKPPGTGDDYTSLNEGAFLRLGTKGVVGELGPELPTVDPLAIPPEAPTPRVPTPAPADPENT